MTDDDIAPPTKQPRMTISSSLGSEGTPPFSSSSSSSAQQQTVPHRGNSNVATTNNGSNKKTSKQESSIMDTSQLFLDLFSEASSSSATEVLGRLSNASDDTSFYTASQDPEDDAFDNVDTSTEPKPVEVTTVVEAGNDDASNKEGTDDTTRISMDGGRSGKRANNTDRPTMSAATATPSSATASSMKSAVTTCFGFKRGFLNPKKTDRTSRKTKRSRPLDKDTDAEGKPATTTARPTTIGIKATTTTLVVPVETVPITTSKAANLRKDDDTAPTTQRLKQVSVPTALKSTVIQDATTRRFLAKKLQSEQENLNDSDELEVTMVISPGTKFRETYDLAVASGNVISLESPGSSPTPPLQHEGRGQGGGGSKKKSSSLSSTSTSTSSRMTQRRRGIYAKNNSNCTPNDRTSATVTGSSSNNGSMRQYDKEMLMLQHEGRGQEGGGGAKKKPSSSSTSTSTPGHTRRRRQELLLDRPGDVQRRMAQEVVMVQREAKMMMLKELKMRNKNL